jgi:ABC-type nitrate/sulfonate/bicarbonate transport system substrate-binding protein
VLTLAAAAAWPRGARAQGMQTLKVAIVLADDVTPLLVAAQNGMFRRARLEVELPVVNSGAAAAAAVAGGAVQLGLSSLVNLVEAHERGVPFLLVAPGSVVQTDDGYHQFVVLKESGIRTARDLNGKTVAVPALRDLQSAAIMNWVEKNGGDPRSLKFVEMPTSAAAVAVEDGRVDGASLNTPALTRAIERGKVRALAQIYNAIAPRILNSAWFGTAEYITANRELLGRFASAVREASLYCNAHHAETVPLIANFLKLDEGLVGRMVRASFAERLDVRDIQPLIELAFKYQLIERRFPAQELLAQLR